MSELTDLAICKKIAEIEGIDAFETYDKVFDKKKLRVFYNSGVKWQRAPLPDKDFYTDVYSNPSSYTKARFSPLTDKALCFDLLVRHSLNLHREWSGLWSACNVCSYDHSENPIDFDVYESDENPQKAICLAIIAKHNKE